MKTILSSSAIISILVCTTAGSAPPARAAETELGNTHSTTSSKIFSLGITSLGGGAISGMMDMGAHQTVQAYLGIPGTSGAFRSVLGGLYRITLTGPRAHGLHVGGGMELGTTGVPKYSTSGVSYSTAFFINLLPAVGIHFSFPGLEALTFSLDGGPQLRITDGSANFLIGPLSGLLGASVHYAAF